VIFLFLHGGPSQYETFDPKQSAPQEIRGTTGEIPTTVPGLTFGSNFPGIARHAHKMAVVRSFVTERGTHDLKPLVDAVTLNANMGSLYSRIVGPMRANGMPTNAPASFPTRLNRRAMGRSASSATSPRRAIWARLTLPSSPVAAASSSRT
jgi:hypothetical protein